VAAYAQFSLARSCARTFFLENCMEPDSDRVRKFVAIEVIPSGGYGNHVLQLIHAFFFGLLANVAIIYCRSDLCWLPENLTFTTRENVSLIVLGPESTITLPQQAWFGKAWQQGSVWCEDFTWRYAMDSLREFLLMGIPHVPTDPSTLYLYIRGGQDIWNMTTSFFRRYRQPPCSFYLGAMSGFAKVRVIGDKWNPCVEMAISAGADWEPYNDLRDTGIMVNSRFIVLASSSRSHAVLALSPIKKRFWYFDAARQQGIEPFWWHGFVPTDFGNGTNCVASARFNQYLQDWAASDWQRNLIKSEPCTCAPM
jgi:hypothetical protein